MLNTREVKEYIEKKNNITLSPTQYQILKAIIRGDVIYTTRGCGRSLLYNGYADYLKEVVARDTDRTVACYDFDSIFTASMLINDKIFKRNKVECMWDNIKKYSPEKFDREFECKY